MEHGERTAVAEGLPDNLPPLAVDIDGTLTDDRRAVDTRVFPVLRAWPAPVVVATGKALPYPVALCEFLRIDPVVIAENGGVVLLEREDVIRFEGRPDDAQAVAETYRARGHDIGWGEIDIVNRWRETELAVSTDAHREALERIAAEHGMTVVDTGFAYHVTAPDVDKGRGIKAVADELELSPTELVAIGDSENDAPAFEVAGTGIAVAQAHQTAIDAADIVTEASHADGFLEAIEWIVDASS